MELRRTRAIERFGALTLTLEVIADLDEALDALCAELEARGQTRDAASFDLFPYFGVVWPSARALAEELAARGDLAGRRILELGCGLAVPSIAAAKLGAQVVANDFHPEVPAFLSANLAHNQVTVEYLGHDWRRSPLEVGEFPLVIGSDLLYDASHAEPLARTLAHHTAPDGTILLTDPGRPHLAACVSELGRLGFTAKDTLRRVAHTPTLGKAPAEVDVLVLELTRD